MTRGRMGESQAVPPPSVERPATNSTGVRPALEGTVAGAPPVPGAAAEQRERVRPPSAPALCEEELTIIRLLARLALEEWLDGTGT